MFSGPHSPFLVFFIMMYICVCVSEPDNGQMEFLIKLPFGRYIIDIVARTVFIFVQIRQLVWYLNYFVIKENQ